MPFFKATIAPEACPAKTAETISYGATFAVLGWLLISNYSGLENIEQNSRPLTNSAPLLTSTVIVTDPLLTPIAGTIDSTISKSTEVALFQMDADINSRRALAPAWYENIDQIQGLESQLEHRSFSSNDWTYPDIDQQIDGFRGDITLSRPQFERGFLLTDFLASALNDLSGKQVAEADFTSEITVKGEVTDRLGNRAGRIQRPQIPRPSSVQRIQRSFVLPPRIQALRP